MADALNQIRNREEDEAGMRAERVRRLLHDFLSRRATGVNVSSEDLIAGHPELREELAAELSKLEVIDRARQQSAADESTVKHREYDAMETALLVRCPHCQTRVEVYDAESLAETSCSSCGKCFRLVAFDAPQRVGRFELLEMLGAGSFGTVWKAHDSELDRHVAVKIPRRQSLQQWEVEEVVREARVAAQLHHRHIVTIYEVGLDGDVVYIVSDLIRGVTLDAWVNERPLTFQATARLGQVIAEALHHAHEMGVVHRDLKPANVLIDEQGEPHLTDFGLAKRTSEEIEMTMDGHLLGTPAYMSPEQARGEAHQCDRRSDVYSLGVVLFEMLTGEVPFRGNMSVLPHKVIHDVPPRPRRLNQYVPRDLETICLKCLEKDPRKRYQTAAVLADEFRRYADGEPIRARPVGPLGRLWRRAQRHPTVASLATVALALLLMILVMGVWEYNRAVSSNKQLARLWAFIRNSGTVEHYEEDVQRAARDPALAALIKNAYASGDLDRLRMRLSQPQYAAEWTQLRPQLVKHSERQPLQSWALQRYAKSDQEKLFAWFVQDAHGLQFARGPVGGDNIGHNYAWRTYFHGGAKDFDSLQEYLKKAPGKRLTGTKLSQPFVTEATDQLVIAVSAPVLDEEQFLGVVGVFLIVPEGDDQWVARVGN